MIDKEKIEVELKLASQKLIDGFGKIATDKFTIKPAPERWSIAEVGEHLIRIETLILQIIKKANRPTTREEPCEKVKYIRATFMDSNKKLTAAGPVIPSNQFRYKEEIIRNIKQLRKNLIDFIPDHDLSMACEAYEHHLFGTLTRVEWIYFTIYHGERHLRQIEQIERQLEKKLTR